VKGSGPEEEDDQIMPRDSSSWKVCLAQVSCCGDRRRARAKMGGPLV
jgi:hypothetical protein